MEAVLAIGELGDFLIKDSDGRLVADDKQIKVHCNDVFKLEEERHMAAGRLAARNPIILGLSTTEK